jgi:hypothetical protein
MFRCPGWKKIDVAQYHGQKNKGSDVWLFPVRSGDYASCDVADDGIQVVKVLQFVKKTGNSSRNTYFVVYEQNRTLHMRRATHITPLEDQADAKTRFQGKVLRVTMLLYSSS